MSTETIDILFSKYNARYKQIEDIVKQFSAVYSGNVVPGERIFQVVENYAKRNDVPIQMLRFPINDMELWAFTFLKQGTIFLCVNTALPINKQLFAVAHELYHIYCFVEDVNQSCIRNGSILKEDIASELCSADLEELEANAFSGMLLMPTQAVREQLDILGIGSRNLSIDDVLIMMEIFAIPYKATVLRLYECGIISHQKMTDLFGIDQMTVLDRISKTGRAKRWMRDGSGTELFGTLLDDFAYNVDHHLLIQTREKDDEKYISSLKKQYALEAGKV